jgi:hypothetical protein
MRTMTVEPVVGTVDASSSSDDHDHFIGPEERLRVAMARQ